MFKYRKAQEAPRGTSDLEGWSVFKEIEGHTTGELIAVVATEDLADKLIQSVKAGMPRIFHRGQNGNGPQVLSQGFINGCEVAVVVVPPDDRYTRLTLTDCEWVLCWEAGPNLVEFQMASKLTKEDVQVFHRMFSYMRGLKAT